MLRKLSIPLQPMCFPCDYICSFIELLKPIRNIESQPQIRFIFTDEIEIKMKNHVFADFLPSNNKQG